MVERGLIQVTKALLLLHAYIEKGVINNFVYYRDIPYHLYLHKYLGHAHDILVI
jgi:hypothetical protein